MLPSGRRIRRSEDFRLALRSGVRSGRPRLVVHLALGQVGPASAGFVVSRQVGGAVVRNRVKRRLRHLVADRLDVLPDGARLVVRALAPAAGSSTTQLGSDLDHAIAAALRKTGSATPQEVTR